MVNQAFIIVIAYRPRRRRRKIPGIGRYPMGPTMIKSLDMQKIQALNKEKIKHCQGHNGPED